MKTESIFLIFRRYALPFLLVTALLFSTVACRTRDAGESSSRLTAAAGESTSQMPVNEASAQCHTFRIGHWTLFLQMQIKCIST